MSSRAFLGRPNRDHTLKAIMKDVHLIAACKQLGIPVTTKQASKWSRQEGAAYKLAMKISDENIKVTEVKDEATSEVLRADTLSNNTTPPQKKKS